MLIIEMAKIELNGGHMDLMYLYRLPKCTFIDYQNEIGFMLIIEIAKIESTGGHIEIMLIIEIAKKESTGGHIEIMHRDCQNRINWRPH